MAADPLEDRLGCTDCERLRSGRVAQPVNTVTSAAFIAAAGVVSIRGLHADAHRIERLSYASILALVGVGSIAFHGPQPRGAKALHDWPIAGLLAVVVATPLARAVRGRSALPGWSRRRGVVLAVTSAAAAAMWFGGRTGSPLCDPDSPLQLHGCWHVLAASGFLQGATILYGKADGH